jgi:PAS domain-containing protein
MAIRRRVDESAVTELSRDRRSDAAAELFEGPGEVRTLARTLDWGATSVGWPDRWTPALRIAARAMLDSPFPICLWCGPEYALVYNDAYRRVLAAKHPAALGQPGALVWAEIWDAVERQFEQVRAGGPPLYFEEARFEMARLEGGGVEDAWFSYSLSSLRDEDGSMAAVLNICPETTGRVLAERSMERARDQANHLQALTAALAATTTAEEAGEVAVTQGVAASGAAQGVISLRVESSSDDGPAELAILRQSGVPADVLTSYERFPLDGPTPTAQTVRTGRAFFLENRTEVLATFPELGHVWEHLGMQALVTCR